MRGRDRSGAIQAPLRRVSGTDVMRRWAEITSFLVGASAALVLLAGWRVPQGRDMLGADVRLSIGQSAIFHLSRTGTVLERTGFRPRRTASTTVVLTNPGMHPLRLRPIAQATDDVVLDRLVYVDV